MPGFAPRVAAQQPSRAEISPGRGAVGLDRLPGVARTAGLEAARLAKPRTQQQPVPVDEDEHRPGHPASRLGVRSVGHGRGYGRWWPVAIAPRGARRTGAKSWPNSARTATFNSVDTAAPGGWAPGHARSRTSHTPGGRRAPSWPAAARTWRRMAFRVTARRAWRLGITMPRSAISAQLVPKLSTNLVRACPPGVDNLAPPGLLRWCSRNKGVAETGRVRIPDSNACRSRSGDSVTSWERVDPSQTARRLRPFARRALITARPPRDFILTRNPWVRARRVLEG
jgi:hypothetical protein